MSLFTSIGLLSLIASPAAAFWRLPCAAPLVVERADPIITPGNVSGHVHQIMGGNGFDFTMTYQSTQDSTCTSCKVHGDMSNYWTPILYFHHQNGSFEKVNQVGGGLVYYLQRPGPNNDKLQAFPEGFRMVAGNPFKRSYGGDFESQAVSYNCLNYNGPAEPETNAFPTHNCPSGLRSQVFFPSCWDGVNLDPPDHKSHMAYPIGAYNSGSCPSTHPVHLVSLFYEIIWDVNKFANQWYGNSQPFVWAMGDPTGYGFHGDFLNGWKTDILQKAIDTCTNDSGRVEDCPVFQLYDDNVANGCKLASRINENVQGPLDALPGCNPVQNGPGMAQIITQCDVPATIGAGQPFFKDLTSSGWSYQGCGTDNYYSRTLTGASTSSDSMTLETCAAFCSGKGFSIFGTEYSRECYCGNSVPDANKPVPGVVGNCNMPCSGDKTEFCGAAGALSLYQKCSGNTCTNAAGVSGPGSSSGNTASSVTSSLASSITVDAASRGTSTTTISKRSVTQSMSSSSTTAVYATLSSSSSTKQSSSSTTKSTPTGSATNVASSSLTTGWSYLTCYSDTVNPRTLPNLAPYTLNNALVTSQSCVSFCDSQGYILAGTEYGGECWCGKTLPAPVAKLDSSKCSMTCKGDASQLCGGAAALSLYGKKSAAASASSSGSVDWSMWKRSSAMERKRSSEHLNKHVHREYVPRGSRLFA